MTKREWKESEVIDYEVVLPDLAKSAMVDFNFKRCCAGPGHAPHEVFSKVQWHIISSFPTSWRYGLLHEARTLRSYLGQAPDGWYAVLVHEDIDGHEDNPAWEARYGTGPHTTAHAAEQAAFELEAVLRIGLPGETTEVYDARRADSLDTQIVVCDVDEPSDDANLWTICDLFSEGDYRMSDYFAITGLEPGEWLHIKHDDVWNVLIYRPVDASKYEEEFCFCCRTTGKEVSYRAAAEAGVRRHWVTDGKIIEKAARLK